MNILMSLVVYGQLVLTLALFVCGIVALIFIIMLAIKAMKALDLYIADKTVAPAANEECCCCHEEKETPAIPDDLQS